MPEAVEGIHASTGLITQAGLLVAFSIERDSAGSRRVPATQRDRPVNSAGRSLPGAGSGSPRKRQLVQPSAHSSLGLGSPPAAAKWANALPSARR